MSRFAQRSLISATVATTLLAAVTPAAAQDAIVDPDNQPTLSGRVDAAIERMRAKVAGDPLAARDVVTELVEPEAYDGVLKGARGTYLTGAGNGADQASLLAALLEEDGSSAGFRFASCALGVEAASTMFDEWRPEARTGLDLETLETLEARLSDPEFRAGVRDLIERIRGIQDMAAADTIALETDLESIGWQVADASAAGTEAPSTHVWLQVQQGESWVDLDTTTADGSPRCTPTRTLPALPDEAMHHTTIRVIGETLGADGLEETTLLEHGVATHEIATSRVAFTFGEPAGLIKTPRRSTGNWAYTPMLRIDNVDVVGDPLYLPPLLGATADAFTQADDALSSLMGRGEDDSDSGGQDGKLDSGPAESGEDSEGGGLATAAWLEVDLRAPGKEPLTLRSEIFDLVGPASRRARSVRPSDVDEPAVIGDSYVPVSPFWQIAVLPGAISAPDGRMSADGVLFSTFDGFSGQMDALLRLFPALHAGEAPAGKPAVVALGLELVEDALGEPELLPVIDALHVPGLPPRDALAAARDALSVIAAEKVIVGLLSERLAPGDVAGLFRAARARGSTIERIDPGDANVGVEASEDALARIAARQAEGLLVLVPASPTIVEGEPVTGWFTVDPATGVVRDQFQNGRHAPIVEEGNNQEEAGAKGKAAKKSSCAAAINWGRAALLGMALALGFDAQDAVREDTERIEKIEREIKNKTDDACG